MVLGVLVVSISIGIFFVARSGRNFDKAYQTYTTLAHAHVEAAYVPGIPENSVRQHLNTVLSRVLAQPMKPSERLALAEEGLGVLKKPRHKLMPLGKWATKFKMQSRIWMRKVVGRDSFPEVKRKRL